MAGIFKAYDVRGLYPEQLNEDIARRVGQSFQFLIDPKGKRGNKIVVGHDMRPHSDPLQAALIDGLTSAGFDVIDIGLVTTPMNYFAVGSLEAAGGVQVTASHNPAPYNGLKFSLHEARPVSGDDGIPLLERKAQSGNELPKAETPGTTSSHDIFKAYGDHVLSFLKPGRKLKVVADAANGMGTIYQPLLERCNIDLIPLYFELDGSFPNHEANPLKPENLRDLSAAVLEHNADLGISFDGDADRAAFVDEKGQLIGSDLATALIAGTLLDTREPGETANAIVYDIRSSRAVPEYIEEKGGVPLKERVGHSFIKATMRGNNALFGGELAGHYYFRENYYADSSLLAVVLMFNILREENKTTSECLAPLRRYAKSPEINFEVEDKDGMMEQLVTRYASGELDRTDGIRIDFDDWWFNVRPSNTEPLLRLVLEAKTEESLEARQAELIEVVGTPV